MPYIEHKEMPVMFNATSKSSHWAISTEVKRWREAFFSLTKAQKLQSIEGPVNVIVHHLRVKDTSRPVDCGAIFIPAKGALDGIVDAKLIPHDGPSVVKSLTFLAPEVAGYHGIGIEIIPIDEQ